MAGFSVTEVTYRVASLADDGMSALTAELFDNGGRIPVQLLVGAGTVTVSARAMMFSARRSTFTGGGDGDRSLRSDRVPLHWGHFCRTKGDYA